MRPLVHHQMVHHLDLEVILELVSIYLGSEPPVPEYQITSFSSLY